MPKRNRSRYAVAAEQWLRDHGHATDNKTLWAGLCQAVPELTSVTDTRKTPRTTCFRDLRKDEAFEVAGGRVALKTPSTVAA